MRPNPTVNRTRRAHGLIFGAHVVGAPVTNVRPHTWSSPDNYCKKM
jgi:hypothetical protein